MSYKIPLAKLEQPQKELIRKMLFFQPVQPFFQKKKRFYSDNENTTPILFFLIEDDIVMLPFMFASGLFKICPNIDIKYPKTTIKFISKLRPYQEEIKIEALEILNRTHSLIISLFTGGGKTFFSLYLSYLQP